MPLRWGEIGEDGEKSKRGQFAIINGNPQKRGNLEKGYERLE